MPSSYRFVLKDSHPLLQEQILGTTTTISSSHPNNNHTTTTSAAATPLKNKIGTLFCCGSSSSSQQPPKERSIATKEVASVKVATASTATKLQGRSYCTERAQAEGGVQLYDVTMGMKYACMSISDDRPNTLRNVGQTNPWQLQGMKLMLRDTGRLAEDVNVNDEIHRPLSYLLPHYYDLQVDHHIDINGWKGGHVLDTQGYIAHNDTTIVLAYRCTTSLKDWLTNLATTTSLWETKDIEQGHSGVLSGLTDFSKNKETATATATPKVGRVHTGFYNNFISSVPAIQQYIDPLLVDTTKPKTFYIVGHSLGGGIAHMAFAYFLLEFQHVYNWNTLPHRLVLVTAGSPRAYTNTMQHRVDHEIGKYHPKGKIQALRLVRDKDTVATVPPTSLGFAHCTKGKCVYITKDDQVIINPNLQHVVPTTVFQKLMERHPSIVASSNDNPVDVATIIQNDSEDDDDEDETAHLDHAKRDAAAMDVDTAMMTTTTDSEDAAYAKKINMIPRSLRDHMPEFYLQPLMTLLQREKQYGTIAPKQYSGNKSTTASTNNNTTTGNNATMTEIISSPCHGGGGEETVDVEVVAATTDKSATTVTTPKEEAATKDSPSVDQNIDTSKAVPTSPTRSKLFNGTLFGRNANK